MQPREASKPGRPGPPRSETSSEDDPESSGPLGASFDALDDPASFDAFLRIAIDEDLGAGDLTTEVAVEPDALACGRLIAKADGVLSGMQLFARVFQLLDGRVTVRFQRKDGDRVRAGDELLILEGPARALLIGERPALNLLARLSGIASLTRRFVDRVAGVARILDTRKTTPGLRRLEKYAVRCGGGENHRMGLFDEVMIKDNHLDGGGRDLVELLRALRERHGPTVRMTAEARNRAEGLAAVEGGADVVLLDNLSPDEMRAWVPALRALADERGQSLEIEASGNVTLETLAEIAASGVDRISIGALTHSAPALDLSLAMEIRRA